MAKDSKGHGSDENTGLPLNKDGTVTVFHHTSPEAAKSIRATGTLKSAGEPHVYFTTHKKADTGYGNAVVPVRVKPHKLELDDEFPNGRRDFRMSVGRPGASISVQVEKPKRETLASMTRGVRSTTSNRKY